MPTPISMTSTAPPPTLPKSPPPTHGETAATAAPVPPRPDFLQVLRDLAGTGEARTPAEACALAARTLAGYALDLPFALLYLPEADGRHVRLADVSVEGLGEDFAPRRIDLDAGNPAWPLAAARDSEALQMVETLAERYAAVPPGAWPAPPEAAVVLPLPSGKPRRPAGFLVAGLGARLARDEFRRGFLELVAAQIATAIVNAGAYESERRRAEALAELDRAKTAFFSNISHEFRTPLSLILGPLEDLLAQPEGKLSAEERELLEMAHRNSQRLLKLVNTLLDFSRIEAGHVQPVFEPVDLAACTEELAGLFRPAMEKAGLKLHIDCPPLPEPVYVDRDMWEKIVLNLVSNAFKYTLEGEVRVSLRAENGLAVLRVQDTGTGIPESELPKLFHRFHRVEGARGRTQEGTGIGLALVQELARLHRGHVEVESRLGKGSTFTVAVPLGLAHLPADRLGDTRLLRARSPAAAPYVEEALRWLPGTGAGHPDLLAGTAEPSRAALRPIPGEGPRAMIVVADDNADMRESLQRLLQAEYDVITVADGQQALQVAMDLRPDLLLTDDMMPNLNGAALLKALREDPHTAGIPVILASASGEEARTEVLRAGADDYLAKPYRARELFARIGGTLALSRFRREARRREQELKDETITILENIGEGFFALDPEFRFTYVNAAAERISGRRREQLLGKELWKVFPALLGTPAEAACRRAMAERGTIPVEGFLEPPGRPLEMKACPAKNGHLTIYFREIPNTKSQ
jgi:signal transduction histidine kinase/DNA-binding response OmpR family regulator